MPISAGVACHGQPRFNRRSPWPEKDFDHPEAIALDQPGPKDWYPAIAPNLISFIDLVVNCQG
jgi:hypothetical protein